MTKDNQNPALKAAKRSRNVSGKEIILSTGIKAILTAVSSSSIIEAQAEIIDPPVPMVKIEGKPGEFENPNDPAYLKEVQRVQMERVQAGIDTLIIMGVELVDGIPSDDKWLKKLQYLAKRGRISLDSYDLNDELDRDFLYKKYIAMSSDDWNMLNEISGINPADIEAAGNLF
jgi:hypothetical protein